MGPKRKTPYTQKFREEWLKEAKLKHWLLKHERDPTLAVCRYCRGSFAAKHSTVVEHLSSAKHKIAAEPFSAERQAKVSNFFSPVQRLNPVTGKAEASCALFVANHCVVQNVDHLTDLTKNVFEEAAECKMHRTKCSGVLKNILYPHFKEELKKDVNGGDYSILVDETTDVSVTKQLGICIVFFSNLRKEIASTFLKIQILHGADAPAIVDGIKSTLADFDLDLQKLRGIGTDNASVMTGKHNGVFAILKRGVSHWILIPCVCHTVQLAVSRSCKEEMPSHLELLLSSTHNWFSHSSQRQEAYATLYNVMFDEDPRKILMVATTPWLSIEPVSDRILNQWDALREYFRQAAVVEKCYTAKTLVNMYNDENNKILLLFLQPILKECQTVNKAFQSNHADPVKLLRDLTHLIQTLAKMLVTTGCKEDLLTINICNFLNPNPSLGSAFENSVRVMRNNGRMNVDTEMGLRKVCTNFLARLITELQTRLPSNIAILKKMSIFAPEYALRRFKDPLTSLGEELKESPGIISKIEFQWEKLSLVEWQEVSNTTKFWNEVAEYADASQLHPFQELSQFVKKLMCLPWSNGEIERAFSQVSILKNDHRNRMKNEMLNALIFIRASLRRLGKCCHSYNVPQDVLDKLGTMEAYTAQEADTDALAFPLPLPDEEWATDDVPVLHIPE